MSLRVCLVTPEFPPYSYGGIGQYVLTLARQLHCLGHRVTLVGFHIHPAGTIQHEWGSSVSLRGAVEGLPSVARSAIQAGERLVSRLVSAVPLDRIPAAWRLGLAWTARDTLAGAMAVRRYLASSAGAFDVVEMPNYPGHGAFVPDDIGAPYVVRLSTPAAEAGSRGNVYLTALEKRTCHKARLVIANSRAMSMKGAGVYGLNGNDIAVIPHGLDDVTIERGPRDSRRMVITYCGRAEPRKGTDVFLRALLAVMPTHAALAVRVIRADIDRYVMDWPGLAPVWHELTTRFGDRIECIGTVDDEARDRLLAESDWTVIPSRFESFGLVAVESMRAGTAVIATDAGGLAEVCRMSPGNIVCANESVTALAEAMGLACDEGKAAAASRGRLVRECYLSHFQSRQMAEATVRAYERLVA